MYGKLKKNKNSMNKTKTSDKNKLKMNKILYHQSYAKFINLTDTN